MSEAEVSIIIPCFNRFDRTQECWKALPTSLPEGLAVEFIFVDSASTDETGPFLKNLARAGLAKVISNSSITHFAKACNQGAEMAAGRFIVFLNNDTIPLKGWIEPLLEILSSEPSVGIIGSKLIYPDTRIQHAGVVVRKTSQTKLHCIHVHRLSDHQAPWVNEQRDYQCVTAACMAMRRELFASLSGFDERYVNGYEDIDLCFRVRGAGYRVIYCPRSVVVHYESSSQGRHRNEEENAKLFIARWSEQISADEDEVYAQANRPNLDKVRSELVLFQDSLAKIRHYQAILDEFEQGKKSPKRGLKAAAIRWLGIDKANRGIARDIRSIRNSIIHLRRVVEGLIMQVDYQEIASAKNKPTELDETSPS